MTSEPIAPSASLLTFSSEGTAHTPTTSEPLKISLPTEVEPYREDIRRFLDAMVFKLGKNAHKGRWAEKTIPETIARLDAERKELLEAIVRGNMVEILLEAADVANFALIVAAIALERGK